MTPGQRLVWDTQRVRRQQWAWDRLSQRQIQTLVGAPRPQRKLRSDPGLDRYLVGGGGDRPTMTGDGVSPRVHHNDACCHCVGARSSRQAEGGLLDTPGGGGGPPLGSFRAGLGSNLGGSYLYQFFDTHSHLFPADLWDWKLLGRTTQGRMRWLAETLASTGIERMVLSGMMDNSLVLGGLGNRPMGDVGHEYELDELVLYAAGLYPDFFVPFVRGFAIEDPDAPAYINECLENGFFGVGELFVHGHGVTYDGTWSAELRNICRVAQKFGAPVQVHWEIGVVDSSDTSASDNYDQLSALLDEPGLEDLVLILAHCGVGAYIPTSDYATQLGDWEPRLAELLSRDNVYFDLAGMQSTTDRNPQLMGDGKNASPLGNHLLGLMSDPLYYRRFLLGIDAESRPIWTDSKGTHPGMPDFLGSAAEYEKFLRLGSFADYQLSAFRSGNIEGLLPTGWGGP